MKYKVTHVTTYDYGETVPLCHNLARLTPRSGAGQQLGFHRLMVTPEPLFNDRRVDYFGNTVQHFSIERGHRRMSVTATSQVEVIPREIPSPEQSPPWDEVARRLRTDLAPDVLAAAEFCHDSPAVRRGGMLADYARPSFSAGRPIVAAIADLSRRMHADFEFDPQATTVHTPLEEAFAARRGVCQDLTHVQLACLRSLGLAARYVSGYVRTRPPAGQPPLVGGDMSHAWVGVFCGPLGWIDTDPTNNCLPSDEHITLALGRDYTDVCPIEGVFLGGGSHAIQVSVEVVPVPG